MRPPESSGIRKNFVARLEGGALAKFSRISLPIILLLVASSWRSHAAAPTLDALDPTGARPGQKTIVTIVGKSDPWPVSAWCSNSAIKISTDPKKKAELIFDVPADIRPGPVFVRLYNAEGASELHTFVIGLKDVPELNEAEPNSSLRDAKPIVPAPDAKTDTPTQPTLPLVINGRLKESGDVDLFPLTLKKGQTLSAGVECYSLLSPIDTHLTLYGPAPEREVISLANDGPGTLDPVLHHTVEADGDYLIGIMGFAHPPGSTISFSSNASAVYRLTLTTGPWLKFPEPSFVSPDKASKAKLHGDKAPIEITLPPADQKTEPDFDITLPHPVRALSHPGFANTLAVPVTALPLQSADTITLPAAVSGTLEKDNETDAFKFAAKKGDKIQFRLLAHYLSSDLDPLLIIEAADGKELKRADDTKPTVDAELLWSSPADGDYVARVVDVIGSGSENHRYLLTAEPPVADFSATGAASKFEVKAGDKTELTVKLARVNDHKLALTAKVENLPAGVTAEVAAIPEKSGDFKITLKAAADAKPANQALRILLTEKVEDKDKPSAKTRPVHFSLVGADWRGPYRIETTRDIWLTVLAKPKPEPKAEEKKAEAKPK